MSSLSQANNEAVPFRICILGISLTSGNRGVRALGASLVQLCHRHASGCEIVFLSNNRDATPAVFRVNGANCEIPVVHARLSPRSRLRDNLAWIVLMAVLYRLLPMRSARAGIANAVPWIGAIERAGLIGDIRGGDSFSDIYGFRAFLLGWFMAWTVLLVRRDLVQFPQTFGPYHGALARKMAGYLLRRSSLVIARDKKSAEVAEKFTRDHEQVLLSPDVAFSMEAVVPEHMRFEPAMPERPEGIIVGINVNGLMYHGGYTRKNMFRLAMEYAAFLPMLISVLLREGAKEVWLIPHTFAPDGDVESDPDASRKVRAALPSEARARVRILASEHDPHELKGIIGRCDFFVGSRMHACIAALSQGVPSVGVAYSRKFGGVFESVGMENWVVDGRMENNESAVSHVTRLFHERECARDTLARRVPEARRQLDEVFRRLTTSSKAQVAALQCLAPSTS